MYQKPKLRKITSQNQPVKLQETIKDPIIIRNNGDYKEFSEKVLQQLILEDLPHFLHELEDGFTFIENEYCSDPKMQVVEWRLDSAL